MATKSSNIDAYKSAVVEALRNAGHYSPALDILIDTLAVQLSLRGQLCEYIATLESPVIYKRSKYGEELKANPIYTELKNTTAEINRLCKSLGLIHADIGADVDEDPAVALMSKVQKALKNG
jgi:hypothetical protein